MAFERFGFSSASVLNKIQSLRVVSPAESTLTYTHPDVLAYAVDRNRFDYEIRQWAEKSGARLDALPGVSSAGMGLSR